VLLPLPWLRESDVSREDLNADDIIRFAKNQGGKMPALTDRDFGWRRGVLGLLIALVMVGQAGTALAAGGKSAHAAKAKPASEAPPPSADLVAAKQAYEEALRAFNLGQWDEAVAGFQKSYKLSGDAALLFNVAQAQRQAGHVKEAIIAYKAFLRERPATPNREMIEAKIRDLETAAEAKTAAQKPGASPAQPDRLTGIWEDPFERKPWAPAVSESPATPVVAAPAALPPASASPVLPEPSVPPAAAPAAALAPVAEPVQVFSPPLTAALDLGQKPAGEESAVVSRSGSRWWLWTGIGVVVVGGVVTAILLATRSPGRDGTCPSGLDGCIPVGK
jgi:hypothetical protein